MLWLSRGLLGTDAFASYFFSSKFLTQLLPHSSMGDEGKTRTQREI
jgi:hypothetical protein